MTGVSTLLSSPWLTASALIVSISTVFTMRGSRDIVIAGSGPDVAVASALLESRRSSVAIYQVATASEATRILQSNAIGQVIVGSNVEPNTLKELLDVRGMRPAIIDATHAVGSLLGRVPMQLVTEHEIRQAVNSQSAFFRLAKRAIDIAFSLSVGLVILPVLPFVALAIKLTSPGGVFYSQERVGLHGKTFRIYKFRSMRQDAERSGAAWAQSGNPRITPVGRFLRLSRFDEIPQIWNVLRGDMTLVGPRPERPEFTSVLEQEIPGFAMRNLVKPGLTGWYQVMYHYVNSVSESRIKLEFDLYYMKYASLRLDLKILFRTIGVCIKMRGC